MNQYPYAVYIVTGTQISQRKQNFIYLMKWTDLHKTQHDDNPYREDDQDTGLNNDEEPKLVHKAFSHNGGINRIRALDGTAIVSLWNENGFVEIYDLRKQFMDLENTTLNKITNKISGKPYFVQKFKNFDEGYGLNWNHLDKGTFASGNNKGEIFIYRPKGQSLSD